VVEAMGMNFANYQLLWTIPAGILLNILAWLFGRYQQKRIAAWINRPMWKNVIPDYSSSVFIWKNITLGLAILFLTISIARPQWGEREEVIQSKGMDVLFLMDLSNSMLAEDIAPSRLNRVQTFIKKTLNLLPDDRVGIVGFAGSAYLAAPLTTDFGYVAEIADSLDPNAIANQGTNIGAAINVAIKAFERGGEDDHKTSRAFVLISDGEDFGKDAMEQAEKLKKFGAGFFTVSVGLPEGAPIPIRNESGVLQTYKKDSSGKPIVSRVNKELLSKVAEAGGGKFIELVNADDAAYNLSKQLLSFTRDSNKEQRQITKIDRYMYFLAAAIFFLLANLMIGYRKRNAGSVSALLSILIFFCSISSQAQTFDSYLNAKQGSSLYKNGEFENSAKAYETSRKEDQDSATLQFNEATALAKDKKNEDAIFNFQEATKKALSQGDYETAAKSLYNEGLTQAELKNLPESYNKLTKAIEMAKISTQPELEKKAREALTALIQKQKQKSQQDKESKDKPGEKGEQKDKKDSDPKNQKDQKDPKDQKDQKGQNKPKPEEDGKKRQFKSGTVSKDVAESIMNDLSDREKQLYQSRMKERKPREVQNEKDW
jgi:Ca-activated chloride channel family protein